MHKSNVGKFVGIPPFPQHTHIFWIWLKLPPLSFTAGTSGNVQDLINSQTLKGCLICEPKEPGRAQRQPQKRLWLRHEHEWTTVSFLGSGSPLLSLPQSIIFCVVAHLQGRMVARLLTAMTDGVLCVGIWVCVCAFLLLPLEESEPCGIDSAPFCCHIYMRAQLWGVKHLNTWRTLVLMHRFYRNIPLEVTDPVHWHDGRCEFVYVHAAKQKSKKTKESIRRSRLIPLSWGHCSHIHTAWESHTDK